MGSHLVVIPFVLFALISFNIFALLSLTETLNIRLYCKCTLKCIIHSYVQPFLTFSNLYIQVSVKQNKQSCPMLTLWQKFETLQFITSMWCELSTIRLCYTLMWKNVYKYWTYISWNQTKMHCHFLHNTSLIKKEYFIILRTWNNVQPEEKMYFIILLTTVSGFIIEYVYFSLYFQFVVDEWKLFTKVKSMFTFCHFSCCYLDTLLTLQEGYVWHQKL